MREDSCLAEPRSPRLGHCFDEDDTGDHRVAGEMTFEEEVIGAKGSLGHGVVLINFEQVVDEEEGVAMG